jgi:hypothetical protein
MISSLCGVGKGKGWGVVSGKAEKEINSSDHFNGATMADVIMVVKKKEPD